MLSDLPWYRFGRGWQASTRAPYADIEITPTDHGWIWRVLRIDPASGQFVVWAHGEDPRLTHAKIAAMDAATRTG